MGLSQRTCVDYTGLNKACPKDLFPLPHIDQVVDSTAGCETLCFLDVYSGYHQIATCIADQLATSFITPFGPTLQDDALWAQKHGTPLSKYACETSSEIL
jgi:hypothetical protein